MPLLTAPWDTRPLTDRVDRAAVRAYAARARMSFPEDLYPGGEGTRPWIPTALLLASMTVMIGGFLWMLDSPLLIVASLFAATFVVVPGVVALALWWARRRLTTRWYRLHQFASANGMQFAPSTSTGRGYRSGSKFQAGSARMDVLDAVSSPGARNLMIGTLRVETGSEKSRTVRVTEFVTLSLARHLPHIVLDAKSNNGIGWSGRLGAEFDRTQRLSLEGNFNDTFTLYCPQGYEADALYLFTPDIMVRMQDHAAGWDVEIIDDELYLYSPKESLGTNPERWQAIGETINALGEKLDQWERWRESRGAVGSEDHFRPSPDFVGYQGRRLKARFPWWMWIAIPASFALAIFGVVQMGIDITTAIGDLIRWILGLFS